MYNSLGNVINYSKRGVVKYIIVKVRFVGTPYRLIRNTLKSVHANLQLCITNVTIKSSTRLD